jgi:hypothetical protein
MSTSKLQQGTQNFSLSLLFSGTQHAARTIEELPWFWTGHSVYCQIQCVLPFFFDLNFINGVLCRYFGSTGQLHLKEYRALFNLQRSRLPGEPFQNDITGKISLSLNMFSNTMQVTHTNLIRVPVILSTLLISCWFLYDALFAQFLKLHQLSQTCYLTISVLKRLWTCFQRVCCTEEFLSHIQTDDFLCIDCKIWQNFGLCLDFHWLWQGVIGFVRW